MVAQSFHILRKLLLILFGNFGCFLELLVLLLVLFEDSQELFLLLDAFLSLFLVGLNTSLDLVMLTVDLSA